MRDYFQSIALELFKYIQKDEFLIINFDAEESNFVRLNKAKISAIKPSIKKILTSIKN